MCKTFKYRLKIYLEYHIKIGYLEYHIKKTFLRFDKVFLCHCGYISFEPICQRGL